MEINHGDLQIRMNCLQIASNLRLEERGGLSVMELAAQMYLFARGDTAPARHPQPPTSPTVKGNGDWLVA